MDDGDDGPPRDGPLFSLATYDDEPEPEPQPEEAEEEMVVLSFPNLDARKEAPPSEPEPEAPEPEPEPDPGPESAGEPGGGAAPLDAFGGRLRAHADRYADSINARTARGF